MRRSRWLPSACPSRSCRRLPCNPKVFPNILLRQIHNAIIPEEQDEESKLRISAVSLPGGGGVTLQTAKAAVTQLNHRERAHLD